jgi:hypothetical protein
MGTIDRSTSFGIQNFFIVTLDESDGTYNYYGYMNRKGNILIMRANKAMTTILYYTTTGNFSTIWAGKSGYTYVLPNSLIDPTI